MEHYFFLYNDNPSAKGEVKAGNKTDAENVPESAEETLFCPKPAGKEADCSIEYEDNVILARRPYFTESDGIVTMQFNAIDWYCVRLSEVGIKNAQSLQIHCICNNYGVFYKK